jgi:hypothetical protein
VSDCPHGFAFAFGCRDEVCNTDRGELRLDALTAVAEAAEAIYHQYHTDEGLLPDDPEWSALGAALEALDAES